MTPEEGRAAYEAQPYDLGVRELVERLQAAGFRTTDSGDGVSKPAEQRTMDIPHVCIHPDAEELISEANLVALFLRDRGVTLEPLGPDSPEDHPRVEASYDPASGVALILVLGVRSEMLR
jgi:hypothetical protein